MGFADCESMSFSWAVAQSPILVTTITLERLRKRGYEALLTYYEKIAPHLNEPLYTRPAWPALSAANGYSGVKASPCQRSLMGRAIRLGTVVCLIR